MVCVEFTLRIAAVISIASCLQQSKSNQPAGQTSRADDDDERAKLFANFSLATFLPPVSKITLPKLPAIPKRSTITLTTTVLAQKTEHVTVYPTCMRLHNIKSLCNGYLETIFPTPILPTNDFWRETATVDSDYEEYDRQVISPSSAQPILSTKIEDTPRKNIIEPSEDEYEYTSSADAITSSLPDDKEDTRKVGNFLDTLLGPKYKMVTEYITVTKVRQYTDFAHTATVQVYNCLPPGLPYSVCDLEHIQPLLQTMQKKRKPGVVKQTVDKVYEHVDQFVLNNPHGLLGISPHRNQDQVYGALNSDRLPSILKTAEQFPNRRSIFDRDNLYLV